MKYVRIEKNVVMEIIPEFDPNFPATPIEERFPKEFMKKLVAVDDDTDVNVGMLYDGVSFSQPSAVPIQKHNRLEITKAAKIKESKERLAEWLEKHPMTFTDGKNYTVTEEKQALLNSNLASYERAKAAGIEYPLKWNATGEECSEWTYEGLVALSLSIAEYVSPKVARQQMIEINIKAAVSYEELKEIVICYDY